MFVKPPHSSATTFAENPLHGEQAPDAMQPNTLNRSSTDPLLGAVPRVTANQSGHISQTGNMDPLGQTTPSYMSSSVRVQPTRPRLDAREAASKLANMF